MLGNFSGYKFVILDLPLLFESGMWVQYIENIVVVSWYEKYFVFPLNKNLMTVVNNDKILFKIYSEHDLQIHRLMQRDHLSEAEAITRINAQMSLEEKCSKAQYVIENSGTLQDARQQVNWIHDELNASNAYLKYRIPAVTILAVLTGGISLMVTWIIGKVFTIGG